MEPWWKVVDLRKEVREGRSFNPDEFAIALEQVVAGRAPEDYRDPQKFFSRTCFTRALREHAGMVLRRLAGRTDNTAPVLALVTQFGGGKTHTLTALYHIAKAGGKAKGYPGVEALLKETGLAEVPEARVAVFVGNAWDPQEGRETPWIDVARQLAGEKGIAALGPAAKTTPPGTDALGRIFEAAGGPILILFDEVLNFLNRHRGMAESFHPFIQNLTSAMTGTQHGAAIISLPRSQVEMSDWDQQWQERICKVVRRVAKDLIVNDEAEIGEVVRRRLFERLGNDKVRRTVAKAYADWCFERRAQLPPEWGTTGSATAETTARELLQGRFEACYPFHPATLSVFQRKWQSLKQYQQTRGTLAMFAQWISWAFREGYQKARPEPLITLGSAPLEVPDFRSVVLGQLGENRVLAGIDTDIAGERTHAGALDADTRGPLRDIHGRVGRAIFFESSGGQTDKMAHLPELRFAIGGPGVDTTSIDNAAHALEQRAYYVRKAGSDGFRIHYQPTLKKVVSDRRASLDDEDEVRPAMNALVKAEFDKGRTLPWEPLPPDGSQVPDSPRLTLVLMNPASEWTASAEQTAVVRAWTTRKGESARLYPAALLWCFKKPGRDLRDRVEAWLAWKRVKRELDDGTLPGEWDRAERAGVASDVALAEEAARDEVRASYRYVVLLDPRAEAGVREIDLGAGHASGGDTLCGCVIRALRSETLLNESVGPGYLDRKWPPALKQSGAWPLAGLRKSFLDGSLERLPDPDSVLKGKIVEMVGKGDFGLASGQKPDGTYERLWFDQLISPDDVEFSPDVFLLTRAKAAALKAGVAERPGIQKPPEVVPPFSPPPSGSPPHPPTSARSIRLTGSISPEIWNRVGTKLIPKLRSGSRLEIGLDFSVSVLADQTEGLLSEIRQILQELGLEEKIQVREQALA